MITERRLVVTRIASLTCSLLLYRGSEPDLKLSQNLLIKSHRHTSIQTGSGHGSSACSDTAGLWRIS
eukprot:2780049-Amphidinium_carterae.3